MDLDTLLNKNQKEAATYLDSHLRIIAGAGSGKTRVVTYRIAHLIQDVGIDPRSILAITFTNKAAKEMRERVDKMAGLAAKDVWLFTFHAFCARVLRHDIDKLGYGNNFAIYDTTDSKNLIKQVFTQPIVRNKGVRCNISPMPRILLTLPVQAHIRAECTELQLLLAMLKINCRMLLLMLKKQAIFISKR